MSSFDFLIHERLNRHLTEVLNDILRAEENRLDRPEDLSAWEVQALDAVAGAARGGLPGRVSEVAALLRVTPAALSAAADLL